MALKDAGVRRAKLGDCEFEFPAPEPEVVPVGPVIVTKPAQTVPDVRDPEEKRPGYAALFGAKRPSFEPAQ